MTLTTSATANRANVTANTTETITEQMLLRTPLKHLHEN